MNDVCEARLLADEADVAQARCAGEVAAFAVEDPKGHPGALYPLSRPKTRSMCFRVAFTAEAANAADVRRLIAFCLTCWGHAELIDGATLATTELFSNAVKHGSQNEHDTVTVTGEFNSGGLWIAVADSLPNLPAPCDASLDEERGRGLALVAAVADGWGAEPSETGTGKRVWFTLLAKGRQGPSRNPLAVNPMILAAVPPVAVPVLSAE